jgi:hypothetical protein
MENFKDVISGDQLVLVDFFGHMVSAMQADAPPLGSW